MTTETNMQGMGFSYYAQFDPSAVAVIDARQKRWTRGELFSLTNRLSRALRSRGLGKGDVLAIMSPNCAEYLATYLAATQIGLYVVSVNWHLSASEVRYVLEDSGAKVVVVHSRLGSQAAAPLRDEGSRVSARISIGEIAGFETLSKFVDGHSDTPLEDPIAGRPMFYTSATTGRPKAILLSLPDARVGLERTIRLHVALGISLGPGNVHLCASMLYHAAPLEGAIVALHMGHIVIVVDRWEPEGLLKLIEEHRVTTSFMVPSMFVRMLKLPGEVKRRYSTASLLVVAHSGAPCPPEIKRQMIDWWGPVFWDSYGATEGGGTMVSSKEWLEHPGTVGRPIPGSRVKILSDEGEELPAGAAGLIYMTRYAGDRFEYKDDPQKTQAAYRGEFFTAGDIGYLNGAGYLFICDRKIDMIISGGLNIYSAEIERLLVLHPLVADCAVFGIPDEILGEAVKAAIQLMPGVEATPELSADILKFLAERLSAAKLPKRMEYVSALPRDPAGKLYKRRLREAHQPTHRTEIR